MEDQDLSERAADARFLAEQCEKGWVWRTGKDAVENYLSLYEAAKHFLSPHDPQLIMFGFIGVIHDACVLVDLHDLTEANGNRKKRLLTVYDVRSCVVKAYEEGWAYDHGGEVAAAYRFPAERTVCVAARREKDGKVWCEVGEGSARKNASPITPIIPNFRRGKHELIQAQKWADSR